MPGKSSGYRRLVVVSGVSGSGKTSLAKSLAEVFSELAGVTAIAVARHDVLRVLAQIAYEQYARKINSPSERGRALSRCRQIGPDELAKIIRARHFELVDGRPWYDHHEANPALASQASIAHSLALEFGNQQWTNNLVARLIADHVDQLLTMPSRWVLVAAFNATELSGAALSFQLSINATQAALRLPQRMRSQGLVTARRQAEALLPVRRPVVSASDRIAIDTSALTANEVRGLALKCLANNLRINQEFPAVSAQLRAHKWVRARPRR